jgi:3-phosphoshikimate 1-carboxyvinyltransferase
MISKLCQKTFLGAAHFRSRPDPSQPAKVATVSQFSAIPITGLNGETSVPGDKSISHRALILAALAVGRTKISGILASDDVTHTSAALAALGVSIGQNPDGDWHVDGVGIGGMREPDQVLDLGNSGTGARLLMGIAAGHSFTTNFTGDASLVRRPMSRVAEPLARMGATVLCRTGDRMPLSVTGPRHPIPISYDVPVPSAQVKSAVLLAGLSAPGETSVFEAQATRDHTERMLTRFGADITVSPKDGGARITLVGHPELVPTDIQVPGDPSSAAFLMVAATVIPNSQVRILNVGMNPLRTGLLDTLVEMGGDIAVENPRDMGGEPVADLTVKSVDLHGVSVPADRAPRMIDEYPILAVAAACAEGTTTLAGLAELRVKESDRLAAISDGLAACGVQSDTSQDSLIIQGCSGPPPGGGSVYSHFDHRIAMAFLVLGLAAKAPVQVDDAEAIATSFPGFAEHFGALGADIQAVS